MKGVRGTNISDQPQGTARACLMCGEPKTAEAFSIHSTYKGKVYRRAICKSCDYRRSRRWKLDHPEHARLVHRHYHRKWTDKNRAAINARKRELRKIFHERTLARDAAKRASNRGSYRAAAKRYRARNIDKCRADARRYQIAHPEIFKIHSANRRDRVRAGGGGYTLSEWKDELAKHPFGCPRCHHPWSEALKPTIDHVVPIAKGGLNLALNLQPLCFPCNMQKGNRIEPRCEPIIGAIP